MAGILSILRKHGIQPTPQRMAVAEFVLASEAHPTAEQVLNKVRRKCSTISRATVYNTLNLLVERQLLRPQILKEGTLVFDPKVAAHHHFIDEETGRVYDVPWEALRVRGEKSLHGFEVREYHVVMRGRKTRKS